MFLEYVFSAQVRFSIFPTALHLALMLHQTTPVRTVETLGPFKVVPMIGIELTTFALRMRCSTN